MSFRISFLILLCCISVASQAPKSVKAGDAAPPLVWTKVLSSAPEKQSPENLKGQVTVVGFFPNTTDNAESVSRWNTLVSQFADKPVNFVWVTSESEAALQPWLEKHRFHGWLLLDTKSESAKAYGMDSGAVIIDKDGTIAGFSMEPESIQITAVLDARALAIIGDANESQMKELLADRAVRLDAEPFRMPPPEQKPDIPPSYEVHISPSSSKGTDSRTGLDYWMRLGFDLKTVVSEVYGKDPSRLVLPAMFDNGKRFDFVLVLPKQEGQETMNALVRQGIEKYFHLRTAVESQSTDVYLMTTVEGRTFAPKPPDDSSGASFAMNGEWVELPAGTDPEEALRKVEAEMKAAGKFSLMSITAKNTNFEDFRRTLEDGLGRPVIDQTNLKGNYDLAVKGEARSADQFIQMLREQVGIMLTPSQQVIETLVLKPTK